MAAEDCNPKRVEPRGTISRHGRYRARGENILKADQQNVVVLMAMTQQDLDMLGSRFRAAIPVSKGTEFDDLLATIDAAESKCFYQAL